MNERRRESRDALREAVLRLAATAPVDRITVTALAQAAGVSRETFYQQSSTVAEVLVDALEVELAALVDENVDLPVSLPDGGSVFRAPTEQLVEHIESRRDVYRNAMAPRLHAGVRDLLTRYIRAGLLHHLQAHPEIAPTIGGRAPGEFGRMALASYGAAGTVGVLEDWLISDAMMDRGYLVDLILAAAPEWWQQRR